MLPKRLRITITAIDNLEGAILTDSSFSMPTEIELVVGQQSESYYTRMNVPDAPEEESPPLGMMGANISRFNYWTKQDYVHNLWFSNGGWLTQSPDKWNTKEQEFLVVDEHGYPTKLEPDNYDYDYLAVLFAVPDRVVKQGIEYVLLYDGEGEIVYRNGITVISTAPGRDEIQFNQFKGNYGFQLIKTTEGNHLRNIRLVPKSMEKDYQQSFNPRNKTFTPTYVKALKTLSSYGVRFMDFQGTNNSEQNELSSQTTLADASFFDTSYPIDLMVQMANEFNYHPWFCFPHQATDEFLAFNIQFIKDKLNPHLIPIFEYSNEVWNGMFHQHQYVQNLATQHGIRHVDQHALLTLNLAEIAQEIYAGEKQGRYTVVFASQAANSWFLRTGAEYLLKTTNAASLLDIGIHAMAIAPYFGGPISRGGGNLEVFKEWTKLGEEGENYLLDELDLFPSDFVSRLPSPEEGGALAKAFYNMRMNQDVADMFGVPLYAYEGGQHLALKAPEMNQHPDVVDLFGRVNTHPRMEEIYKKYFHEWNKITNNSPFFFYQDLGVHSKYGSWGVIEDLSQLDTAKARAINHFVPRLVFDN